ncbi:uncharacterized protein DUF397 [Streptomyces puniciscabiei]|uniref:Uncharacterized protein DUF397 n=1 Tax=Streptomyces puniciscabiei TaxID=164348 RepID=A0A542UI57_9ACTN|nr:DUF397 domain-containing protein [Streptomyces puniciscabiei]TQK98770.1 uncharacterized protein DUF397 [Streptomyces puniciscabiei]
MTASELHWFKSTYSGGSGTECVECAPAAGDMNIRDSKKPGSAIRVRHDAWQAFIRMATHSERIS